ncbi:MAG: hypothetical protein EWV53_13375 [Microcystis panniformis Mp_MB_F_20051200_S9]|uniref:Uncharacterized protein n=1 Tax=Microcystis panniformis Mp_MB_F_20051200_S9 TaxID=2486223 RepID=A0A552PVU5_9CHRO|nr:MAG: hypothetical protein EWV43_20860 [Microcystis panniformis Mp_MB_F_20080800_S26D]TRV53793.1 MAG: hypothetical protein EWV42_05310 [Microcystis panniformis Mp_GB_SS_20050300_S99D]TRV54533.1 MAG: hypothetical protein EWV87_00695 [Microcystis panniformis Mp_GB_SS_20050300_S99]TRV55558.1 MAG: hypothetical protein EWV86_23950 [Microcystis panniformis Mp_MB_F_20051200_S9D]TRV57483.1 MAG: hypothetical protein EWV69_15910 [Microcystis panniformis Mp_MB_F_20080800_S26]TRV61107.1 MAG: hypothetica
MKASNYQEIARAAILAGGLAAAGVLSVGEESQAQFIGATSQSRVSGATTSILTDGNTAATNSFAIEQVLPSSDYVFSSPISVQISYNTLDKDNKFVAITGAVLTATVEVNAGTQLTVERATADAISQAAASQFGDVSGIVRAWSAGTSVLE